MSRRLLIAVASIVLASAGPAVAAEVHPFYEQLLGDGKRALYQGEAAAAESSLRLAAFGLLEAPDRLAEALVPLALAYEALGDASQLAATLDRLMQVETQFGVYEQANVPSEWRSRIEDLLVATYSADALAEIESFAPLAERRLLTELESLPADARRQRLAQIVAERPEEPRWAVELAELELASGAPESALANLESALTREPENRRALCLRGSANAALARCEAAVVDLPFCSASAPDPDAELARIQCLLTLGRPSEAQGAFAALGVAATSDRRFRRLRRDLDRALAAERRRAQIAARERGRAAPTPDGTDPQTTGPAAVGPANEEVPSAAGDAADETSSSASVAAASPRPAAAVPADSAPAESVAPGVAADQSGTSTPEAAPDPCQAGITMALQGRCVPALQQLELCPEVALHPRAGVEIAACLLADGEAERAAAILADLGPSATATRRFRRVDKRVQRELASARARAAAVLVETEADQAPARAHEEAPPAPATGSERPELEPIRQAVNAAASAAELQEPLRRAREVADRYPDWREAQYLAAESAYRASNWDLAARYFRRGGQPPPERPELLFYYAIALHETGDNEGARRALLEVLPLIRRTPFVDRYAEKILGAGDPGG